MKRLIYLTTLLTCLGMMSTYAAKWRVNNSGIQADFSSASAAANSPLVSAGDTLYFESSTFSYGSLDLTKRLVIIGPGYFLGENDSTQANPQTAVLDGFAFTLGSDGTIVKGMTLDGWVSIGDGNNAVSNITLERNNIGNLAVYRGNGHVFLRNYISNIGLQNCNNVLLSNNIVTRQGSNGYPSISMNNSASAMIVNNIFLGHVFIVNSVFRNNICTYSPMPGVFVASNCVIENNLGASTQFETSNGNQQNVDMSTVFIVTGSTDGKYRLKPGSPAIAAGAGGTDCGVYGGNYPYVPSGMVAGPSVWYMNMNGIDVTVKAKSH
ncbi:MAG TPA: right-handed parallel beta-helix repeat-containing protein [Bacteroidales bacterium]|nr:right-handed parallel beta-helix repeat-containing protein [Bacteroidales bacterium]